MFTGLIEEIGIVKLLQPAGGGFRLTVNCDKISDDIKTDDSVAINGVCQTVVSVSGKEFTVEAVEETLKKTTFKNLKAGAKVNLERAMKLGSRFGGHIVQGHVDCAGRVVSIEKQGLARIVGIEFPAQFGKYAVAAGSICIDGVSLTIARIKGNILFVSIIPHTWDLTIMKQYKSGSAVNLEFDIIGKYVESMTIPFTGSRAAPQAKSILERFIEQPDF